MILAFCLVVVLGCTAINAYEGNGKMAAFGFVLTAALLAALMFGGVQ